MFNKDNKDILVKPLLNGSVSICLLNKDVNKQTIAFDLKSVPELITKLQ